MRASFGGALAAALALMASCSSGDVPVAAPPSPAPTSAQPSPPAAKTSRTSQTPEALTAADGSNAKACSDGRCQIVVKGQTDFALNGKFNCDGIVVTYRKPDEVNLIVAVADGDPVNATITGTGNLRLAYGLTLTVERTTPAGAVLRVAPQKNDPGNHTGTGTKGFSLWSGQS